MNKRNKIIAGALALASVTQVSFSDSRESYKGDNIEVSLEDCDDYSEENTDSAEKVSAEASEDSDVFDESVSTDELTTGAAVNIIEQKESTEITTSAAVFLDELSPDLINLQNKVNQVWAKVEADKKNGIKYAENRLSDLYLDGVKDNDNLKDFKRIIDEAKKLIEKREADETVINKYISDIDTCYSSLRTIQTYNSFSGVDGGIWKDTNGVKIQAHGGQVQKINGKWWWYGEDKTKGYRSNGISAYSSDDLYNWTFEGYVMRDLNSREQLDTDPYFSELYKDYSDSEKDNVYLCINNSSSVIERPKVIYNEKTGKYVLWFHDDGPTKAAPNSNYAAAAAGVAVSDSPNGPFKFIDRYRLNVCPEDEKKGEWYESSAGFARDMNLFVDDDNTAYIVYSSEENRTMFISKLNGDYTYLSCDVDDAVESKDFVRLFPGAQREAPALFKYNDKYYLITSGATGWDPNQARYWTADDILGEWTDKGDPCINDTNKNTFSSQSTNVTPINDESGKFIFMADRWKSNDLGDSRYIWLPLEFAWNGNLSISSYNDWDIDDLNNKYSIKVNSELQEVYTDTNELPSTLNVGVYEDDELVNKDVDVTWNIDDLQPLTKTTVTGTLEGLDREITTDVILIPDNLKYYIDCGDEESDIYNIVNEKSKLINNDKCDKAYTEGSWGYTGIIGTDINYKNKDSKDSFNTGYWAYGNKSIDYKMHLNAGKYKFISGFNEWWNTSRNMNVTLSYVNEYGRKVNETLGQFTNKGQKTVQYEFSIPEDTDVTISVSKVNTSDPDPILSWLAVQSLNEEKQDNEDNNNTDSNTGKNDNDEENSHKVTDDKNQNNDQNDSSEIKNEEDKNDTSNKEQNNNSSNAADNTNSTSNTNNTSTKTSISKSSSRRTKASESTTEENLVSQNTAGDNINKTVNNINVNEKVNDGWNKLNENQWQYIENGKAICGWKYIDNKWYYMNDSAIMLNGWQYINNKWYYLSDSGDMVTGWKCLNNKWYYLTENGDMVIGWSKINEKWYYFDSDGAMISNTTIDGYTLSESGEMI